jgi:hypothetical protein
MEQNAGVYVLFTTYDRRPYEGDQSPLAMAGASSWLTF